MADHLTLLSTQLASLLMSKLLALFTVSEEPTGIQADNLTHRIGYQIFVLSC